MRIDSIEFNVFIDWINIVWPSDDPVKRTVRWKQSEKEDKKKAEKEQSKNDLLFLSNHVNRLSDRAAIF